jgi:restriction system protein
MTSVPTYDQFIEPVLRTLVNYPGGIKTGDVYQHVADTVGLSEAQREELLASGRRPYYKDRICWAFDRIKRAGYGESKSRGVWSLTEEGRVFIAEHEEQGLSSAEVKDIADLGNRVNLSPNLDGLSEDSEASHTPEETIDIALSELNQSVADELMTFILALTPDQFELLVLDVLLAMGYGADRRALQRVGGSGDGGIDGVVTLDRLGLEKVYVQAKRWAPGNTVGRPDIQGFYGALAMHHANKGVFITTSSFSHHAIDFARNAPGSIVLVDGETLTHLMIEFGVGVSTQRVVKIVRVDSDYFEEV